MRIPTVAPSFALAAVLALGAARVEPSVSSDPQIVFGMSTALNGPTGDLGRDVRAGVLAAFDESNRAGGIGGRRLELIALDDGYEPARTTPNMRRLVDEDRVLAIIGNVGTPTAMAAMPIARAAKTLFFGAYTGSGALRRDPPERYVINFRASYAEETSAMVDALIREAQLGCEDVALFTQRDSYGDAVYSSTIDALQKHGLSDVRSIPHVRYERNTVAVEGAVADLLLCDRKPKAFILVGTYAPCAAFIRQVRGIWPESLFLNVSFVGATSLARELGDQGDGVVVTQVVPSLDCDVPLAKEFRAALAAEHDAPQPTFGAFEGYAAARTMLLGLRSLRGAPSRENIIDALEGLGRFDLGLGEQLALSKLSHQASHGVWPTVIRRGKVVPFAWSELRKHP